MKQKSLTFIVVFILLCLMGCGKSNQASANQTSAENNSDSNVAVKEEQVVTVHVVNPDQVYVSIINPIVHSYMSGEVALHINFFSGEGDKQEIALEANQNQYVIMGTQPGEDWSFVQGGLASDSEGDTIVFPISQTGIADKFSKCTMFSLMVDEMDGKDRQRIAFAELAIAQDENYSADTAKDDICFSFPNDDVMLFEITNEHLMEVLREEEHGEINFCFYPSQEESKECLPDLTLRVYTSDYANEVVVDVIKNEYEIVGDTINNRGNLIDSSGFVASETADGMTGKLIMQGVKSLFDTYQWYAIADTYSAYDVVTSGKIGDIFHQKQLTIDPIPSEFLAWKEDENYLVPTTDTYQVIHYTIKDVPFTDVGWYEKAREWLYGTYGEVLFTEDVEVTYVVSYDCLGIVENIKARIGYASDAASFAACVSDYVAAVDIGGRNEPEDAFLTAEVLKGFDDRFYGTKEGYLGHFNNARYFDLSYNACESIKELPQIELSAMDQAQTLFDRKYQSFTFRPGEILDVTTTMFDGSPCETKTYASK